MKKLALLVATCAVLPARASVICVAPTSTTAGSIEVTSPVTFTITTAANAVTFDLSGWVTSDGSQTFDPLSPNLAYSLNGTAGSQPAYFVDNLAGTAGNNIGPNDGYFLFANFNGNNLGVPVAAGNTLTLLAGTYTLPATNNFNPQATQTFNGNMFVTDGNGVRISNTVSLVPEPSTWALFGVGVVSAGMAILHRRQQAA